MTLAEIGKDELGKTMRERLACILRMRATKLYLTLVNEHSPQQLIACCDRMTEYLGQTTFVSNTIQTELVQNTQFAPWLAQLLALMNGQQSDGDTPRRDLLQYDMDELLEACWDNDRSITDYTAADVLFVQQQSNLSGNAKLTYLENFSQTDLDAESRAQVIRNLDVCQAVPITLSKGRRALLAEPFVATRYLFAAESFEDIYKVLQAPTVSIIRLLHQRDISEVLTLKDYQIITENGNECLRILTDVLQYLDAGSVSNFINFWKQNGCPLAELQRLECWAKKDPKGLAEALKSRTGYFSLLYGRDFKKLSLTDLTDYQEAILIFALTHNKKHFIKLVDDNAQTFRNLSRKSILFHEPIYRRHLNLNELTAKDLVDCAWIRWDSICDVLPNDNRQYTFPELKLLCCSPENCVRLYNKLRGPRVDDRMNILRQLRKRNFLSGISSEEELDIMAGLLDQKPFSAWQQRDMGHIEGIKASDVAQVMLHLDKLRPLLAGMHCRADVMLALRCLKDIDRYESMDELKADLLETDQEWLALKDTMKLDSDFEDRHRDAILAFLSKNGAGVVKKYQDGLSDDLSKAFFRVVKAELMGQFADLKYHAGDLERELDIPITAEVAKSWAQNIEIAQHNMKAREFDDFFSTMLMGTQPQRTCLSYIDGMYRSCLLACFDSNKKVMYAEKDGQVVGRASIRLTKCCLTGAPSAKNNLDRKISFVDLEDKNTVVEEQPKEQIALFLERPYSSKLNPEEEKQVAAMFISLAKQKAEMLGAMLVMSLDYQNFADDGFIKTGLYLYISASKAGSQYLDSLGGEAGTTSECSYKKNIFLVEAE